MMREDDIDHEEHRAVQQAIDDERVDDWCAQYRVDQEVEAIYPWTSNWVPARVVLVRSHGVMVQTARLRWGVMHGGHIRSLPSEHQEYQFVFGDRVTTTDSSTPEPVVGFRSDTGPTGKARPFILVGGAWYYPHELEIVTLHTREELLRELSTIRECLFSGQKSRAKLVAQGAFQSLALRLGIEWTPPG